MSTPKPKLMQEVFSEWVAATRKEKEMIRRDFTVYGLSTSGIKAIEDHAHDVRMSTFVNICYAFNVDPVERLRTLLAECQMKEVQ